MSKSAECPHCHSRSFSITTQRPVGANYDFNFIQCSNCAAPIGVVEYNHTYSELQNQKAAISEIQITLQRILLLMQNK